MSERKKLRPFTGDDSKSFKLKKSPVRLVLCKLDWPDLIDLPEDLDAAAKHFGRAIAGYPVFEEHTQNNIVLTPTGSFDGPQEKIYQWKSADNEWCVILGRRFLSFYRVAYSSFSDFRTRFERVLQQLEQELNISAIERVGLRHVNQVADAEFFSNPLEYVEDRVLGFAASEFATDLARIESSQNQIAISVNDAVLQARCGILPPMQSVDQAVPQIPQKSWVLDLDSSVAGQRAFSVEEILAVAGDLADINYDFFKFATTDKFLERFGSE